MSLGNDLRRIEDRRRAEREAAEAKAKPTLPAIIYEGAIPTSLRRACDKRADCILEVSHDEDGYWVILRAGWTSTNMECQTIHENTVEDCLAELGYIEKEAKP